MDIKSDQDLQKWHMASNRAPKGPPRPPKGTPRVPQGSLKGVQGTPKASILVYFGIILAPSGLNFGVFSVHVSSMFGPNLLFSVFGASVQKGPGGRGAAH